MNTTKKRTEPQLVSVDAGKLSQGLTTAFEGIAMIFESMGGSGITVSAAVRNGMEKMMTSGKDETVPEKQAEKGQTAAAIEDEPEVRSEDTDVEKADGHLAESRHPVTLDDVTKIIVQKIKQDRGNNEKIGQILKTYGAARVGELPEAKYEAFLTDLAAL